MNEWRPERTLSAAQASALLGAQFPELAGAPVTPFAEGWDNTSFLVDDTWVVRFPRRAIAAPLIEHELAVLPWLAPRLPVAVPVPELAGRPSGEWPWPFAGYRRLPGRTVDQAALDDAARARLGAELTAFLAALHALPAHMAPGLPDDTLGRLDVTRRAPPTLERVDQAARQGLVDAAAAAALRRLVADTPRDHAPAATTLCHGDLHARNLLVADDGALLGVIDWGDVHRGDGLLDVAALHGLLPAAPLAAARAALGPFDDRTWRVARFRAVFTVLALLVSGHDEGRPTVVAEAQAALRRLLAA